MKADYDSVMRQRNALLKNAGQDRRRPSEYFESTLAVWDEQLVRLGAELTAVRAALVEDLRRVAQAYAEVAKDAARSEARVDYVPSVPLEDGPGGTGTAEEKKPEEARRAGRRSRRPSRRR